MGCNSKTLIKITLVIVVLGKFKLHFFYVFNSRVDSNEKNCLSTLCGTACMNTVCSCKCFLAAILLSTHHTECNVYSVLHFLSKCVTILFFPSLFLLFTFSFYF